MMKHKMLYRATIEKIERIKKEVEMIADKVGHPIDDNGLRNKMITWQK